MKYKILEQEAYASTFQLSTTFKYKGKTYCAYCVYYNEDGLEDIEVEEKNTIDSETDGNICEIAKQIFHDMDINKFITH